jgi:hypothetical protein
MEQQILEIITHHLSWDLKTLRGNDLAKEITSNFKAFIDWKDDPHCPFTLHYNGEDPTKPKISYDKGGKNYTLDQVYNFWVELKQ